MKIPVWKKLLSYVMDVHLESHSSTTNPNYDNFYKIFKRINQKGWHYNTVLILGFGLGSIPTMIEKKMNRVLHYTGIELDDIIVELVSDYVLPNLQSSIEIINADAEIFIQTCEECYDMICVDVFLDDVIPKEFLSETFMQKLGTLLNPEGLVVLNMLADYKSDKEKAEQYFDKVFKNVFPKSSLFHTGTNYILVSQKTSYA